MKVFPDDVDKQDKEKTGDMKDAVPDTFLPLSLPGSGAMLFCAPGWFWGLGAAKSLYLPLCQATYKQTTSFCNQTRPPNKPESSHKDNSPVATPVSLASFRPTN
ncbi:MAG: hypothetical protein KDD10_29400, partial [Phaeodactylibacter sp.]|nr:hypothetical protein [Phaeodactylibacter sp.]